KPGAVDPGPRASASIAGCRTRDTDALLPWLRAAAQARGRQGLGCDASLAGATSWWRSRVCSLVIRCRRSGTLGRRAARPGLPAAIACALFNQTTKVLFILLGDRLQAEAPAFRQEAEMHLTANLIR